MELEQLKKHLIPEILEETFSVLADHCGVTVEQMMDAYLQDAGNVQDQVVDLYILAYTGLLQKRQESNHELCS